MKVSIKLGDSFIDKWFENWEVKHLEVKDKEIVIKSLVVDIGNKEE